MPVFPLLMRNLAAIILLVSAAIVSCSRPSSALLDTLDTAERVMQTDVDSAMTILDALEPSDLTTDSLRARYSYLRAVGHMRQNRSMIGDSLITMAHEFYKGRDIVKEARSGIALAWYRYWVGDPTGAIGLLDSIAGVAAVPDTIVVQALRVRGLLGAAEYQGEEQIPVARRLMALERDTMKRLEATYLLINAYEGAGKYDSALVCLDSLIEIARSRQWGEKHFLFMVERAQILTELGREKESEEAVAYIFDHAGPENGAADYLHLQRAINALNTGNPALAERELALADSFAARHRKEDDVYYRSYSNLLHAMIDFRQGGRLKLRHVNGLNNRQQERYSRMKASQWESERGALQQQSRALALKAESDHKTIVILILTLIALIIAAVAIWVIRHRRQRERENEDRAEALQQMVDELKAESPHDTNSHSPASKVPDSLRRAMLQQLGIIKMVAETPTEQNREMLRKISSIGGETNGELVNWQSVYEVIDNLYSGFHTKLHDKYGSSLTEREEQIIVLMTAGFSTKEISVITGHATSSIYVRKSSIRKKLSLPEKEDIVLFLRREFSR